LYSIYIFCFNCFYFFFIYEAYIVTETAVSQLL